MSNTSLVSIVTPVLNGMKYLETCLQSVLCQTYPNIEHIFIDGGSTDRTLDMLSNYQERYPDRIRFISEPDMGVGEAVNKGFRIAKGDIFGWLDSDDLYEPDAVAHMVGFFGSHPDAYFIFGGCDIIDEKGELLGSRPVKDFNLKEAINDRHYIFLPAVFYRREAFEKAGQFNALGNDLDFYLRVADDFELHKTDKTLARYRVHGARLSDSQEPGAVKVNRNRYREDYLLCRQHGGSIFTPRVRRYIIFLALDRLGLYHFVSSKMLPKLRRYLFMHKLLRLLGA